MIVFGTTHAYFIHTHLVNGTITRKVPYDSVNAFETGRGILFGKIILTLGEDGLKDMSRRAILNANYIRSRLSHVFKCVTNSPCMHEVVFSGVPALQNGAKTLDIAKRLLDYGFYAPTIYFPLIVPECLMIEPTETETPETLEEFCCVVEKIVREIKDNPTLVKEAPHTTPVRRLDEVQAARSPVLKWDTWEENMTLRTTTEGSKVSPHK